MGNCRLIDNCPFFNDKMVQASTMSKLLKESFCKCDFVDCARFVIYEKLGREYVPKDLFPNQKARALEILHKAEESTC